MGSEHYCLRWNNHQSNLLGVFSQLLQDESLVDVTLACSEGASIRAHKVVLSACSSYFQSLFLDHPSRHPIVILKDVRFSELQTLVEFMYKGEVNVQYCQLSALLKTAESLKVKGLAEMTNQSTALREPEREPDRLRPHSQPKPSTACDTSLETAGGQSIITQTTSSTTAPSPSSSNSTPGIKHERERGSPSPPPSLKRLHQHSPGPLDLYQKRCPSRSNRELETITIRTPTNIISDDHPSPNERLNSTDDEENMSNDVGLNMTLSGSNQSGLGAIQIHGSNSGCLSGSDSLCNINASGSGSQHQQQQSHQQILSATQSVVVPPMNSSGSPCPIQTTSTDLTRPLSRSSGSGAGGGGGGSGNLGNNGGSNNAIGSSGCIASSSRISSPILSTEPVAGPSGLGPVQSVPLSLKKEVDWERTDEKPSIESMEYHRHSHDSETSESPHGLGGGGGNNGGITSGGSCTAAGSGLGSNNSGGGGSGGGSGLSSSGGAGSLDQGGPVYPCMYCGATFPHQSKLTRHILSHSLETLKYRETAHLLHPSHLANLLPHELPPLPQHFSHRQIPPPMEPLEPPDGSSMDIDFATAAAAAVAAAANLTGAGGGGSSGGSGGGGMSTSVSISGLTSAGMSIATSSGVFTSSGSTSSSAVTASDPNSVVLCKFCGKSFPDVASLITHLPVHTGDRPFKCEFCGKAFKLRHHMKDHCRVHTGERPFRCSMCGKTFSRSTILKAHEKTHFPKYVRKFLSPSPVDTKDELPQ